MSRPAPTENALLRGAAGALDVLIDVPAEVRGIAVVCHPHPLYGGANTNKVTHTLARAFRELGYAVLRPNFRGVGKSEGSHDLGNGETEDTLAVVEWARQRWGDLPLALGGFSFGSYVQCRVANQLAGDAYRAERFALVGMAAGNAADGARQYDTPPLPAGLSSLIIHGENDETVPLANVLDWARPQELPVVVVPGADHFFHGKLHLIRDFVARVWAPR
ncbi:alpha/beta fold hydrolase [Pseudothauera nasutitermitis]|uniref:Alpha/beta fold hydrolase n=1 Tax=Pseudothauera nasutitermitis TaxID=2565930 RepID=A0A4S4AW13_9RHOO|nr:alpha/beta fold hydrolase [Pseudothauera nasutitermitis]THF64054.1 alpha/beta fold hydrolase [Pseudothauera nasutitermitis]